MPAKLSTTVSKIKQMSNENNAKLISSFYEFMKENNVSERHQNNNLKCIIAFANFYPENELSKINKKEDIQSFLNTKIKSKEDDPDQKWITTYNDYLHRIKHFYRWLYNEYRKGDGEENLSMEFWQTPSFLSQIKVKRTKRLSPYLETEIWEKEEILTVIKYEPMKRNKAILSLLWDLDARPHEITLLKIKHIRLREKYGEGEIPDNAKTGSGPVLLTCSFPYVRDWLNEHPFKNESNARLICNLITGAPIRPDAINEIMKQLKNRIIRLLENNEISDNVEKEKIEYLLKTKKWNPYCIRHSAITADSDYLPEYALKKKVRWSMNSKQGIRYIKKRMGNDLKEKILSYNGIVTEKYKEKITMVNCPRCDLVNAFENKYCSKCSYPLRPEAYDELKMAEEDRIKKLEQKYEKDMKDLREEMENKFTLLLDKLDVSKIN